MKVCMQVRKNLCNQTHTGKPLCPTGGNEKKQGKRKINKESNKETKTTKSAIF